MASFNFKVLLFIAALVSIFKTSTGDRIEGIFTTGPTAHLKFSTNLESNIANVVRIGDDSSKLVLAGKFFQYVTSGKTNDAMNTLQMIISLEKLNRMKTCMEVFGPDACSEQRHVDPRPFYIWKRKFIHNLLQDPTKIVIRQLQQMSKNFNFGNGGVNI